MRGRWGTSKFTLASKMDRYHMEEPHREFLTHPMIKQELKDHPYIVTGPFIQDANFDGQKTARVEYKGRLENEAESIWKSFDENNGFFLFTPEACYDSSFSDSFYFDDISILEHLVSDDICTKRYLVAFCPFDPALGQPVKVNRLIQTNEDVWHVVRVCDLNLNKKKPVGQIIYTGSKQEAANIWLENMHYLIFNPRDKAASRLW